MANTEPDAKSDGRLFLSVVMPAYNEAGSIEAVVEEHVRAVKELSPTVTDFEVVVVDDGSTDRTPQILDEIARRVPQLRVEKHKANLGIFRAFDHAHRLARGTHVFSTASDGQWPVENLDRLLSVMIESGADLVLGVRTDRFRVYTPWRRLVSCCFSLLPRLLFGVDAVDPGSIKLGRREIFQCGLISRSAFAEAERIIIVHQAGFRMEVAPISFLPRRSGRALGAKLSNVATSAWDCLRCFWAYRIVGRLPDVGRGPAGGGLPFLDVHRERRSCDQEVPTEPPSTASRPKR